MNAFMEQLFEPAVNMTFLVMTILAALGLLSFSWWWVLGGFVVSKVVIAVLAFYVW